MNRKTIVFVCYGNMCRSPMAEGILRSIVDGGDVRVLSAGVSAVSGGADPHAVRAMRECEIDISSHRRKQFEAWMAEEASHIFALDDYVHNVLQSEFKLTSKLYTLKGFALGVDEPLDVFDPYRDGIDAFRECRYEIAELIDRALERGLLE